MKQFWRIIERYYPWLLLLLGVDCFCSIILWISDIQAFQTLIGLVVLTSILLFSVILFVLNKRETTRRELFRDFLSDPTICNEERLLSVISREEGESIRLLASVLRKHKTESSSMADALRDYRFYLSACPAIPSGTYQGQNQSFALLHTILSLSLHVDVLTSNFPYHKSFHINVHNASYNYNHQFFLSFLYACF